MDAKKKSEKQTVKASEVGKKHSAVWVERIAKANSKKIVCVDTGEIFNSMKDAIASVGRTNKSHICQVCQGKRKSAYGYRWKYYEEGDNHARIG